MVSVPSPSADYAAHASASPALRVRGGGTSQGDRASDDLADGLASDAVEDTPPPSEVSLLGRVSFFCAWGVLAIVFAAAYVQGFEFASDKSSATVWGGAIGLSAFFAWIAVVEEDEATECEEAEQDSAEGVSDREPPGGAGSSDKGSSSARSATTGRAGRAGSRGRTRVKED